MGPPSFCMGVLYEVFVLEIEPLQIRLHWFHSRRKMEACLPPPKFSSLPSPRLASSRPLAHSQSSLFLTLPPPTRSPVEKECDAWLTGRSGLGWRWPRPSGKAGTQPSSREHRENVSYRLGKWEYYHGLGLEFRFPVSIPHFTLTCETASFL